MLVELFENGYIAQFLLILFIWGVIAFLAITGRAIPDPLLDAGFMVVGFYFRAAIQNGSTKVPSRKPDARDTLPSEADEGD